MFKRRGEGVKGFLKNVQKNCTFLTARFPYLEPSSEFQKHTENLSPPVYLDISTFKHYITHEENIFEDNIVIQDIWNHDIRSFALSIDRSILVDHLGTNPFLNQFNYSLQHVNDKTCKKSNENQTANILIKFLHEIQIRPPHFPTQMNQCE